MLGHIRKAIFDYPQRFKKFAVLDCKWMARFNATYLNQFSEAEVGEYEFDDDWDQAYRGEYPYAYPKSLRQVDNIYAPFHISNSHWVALQIDLPEWKVIVYDSQLQSQHRYGLFMYF